MVCMDVHNNPVNQVHRAGARSDQFDAPLLLNQVEGPVLGHDPSRPGTGPEHADDDVPRVGVIEPRVPGTVFTGDASSQGGPGATARWCSSFEMIIESVHGRLKGMA